jgi:predicted transcriptional regulator
MVSIKLSEKYHPKTVTKKILAVLQKSEAETPTGIARKTGYNPKTIVKYIEMLEELDKITCTRVPIGKREFKICSIKREKT